MAWGEKGHYLSNEAATFGVPNEMPAFFHEAYPSLVYLGYEPDRWRGAGDSLDGVNPPDHFLDYEYVSTLPLPPNRYQYAQLLVESGTLKRFGIALEVPGFLPWRIAELTQTLTVDWRLWRNSRNPVEKAQIEQNIIFVAGVLGHFVADAANPHHASTQYNGWLLPNPMGYATDCDTHARFETVFVTQVISIKDVVPRLRVPILRPDAFATALELIRDSNSRIDRIYELDRQGSFIRENRSAEGRAFAADRMAVGASYLRDLWWSAYKNSQRRPEPRREP